MIFKGDSKVRLPRQMLAAQVVLTLVMTAGGLFFSRHLSLSILLGGGACAFATALFAASVFGPYQANRPGALLGRIVGAEIGKLILVVGIFVFSFVRVEGLNVPAMLIAYFAVQVLPAMIAPRLGADS